MDVSFPPSAVSSIFALLASFAVQSPDSSGFIIHNSLPTELVPSADIRLAVDGFVNNLGNMRLRKEEKSAILAAVKGRDRDARVILFGSRVDDSRRGGDIDLFIVSETLGFRDEWCIRRDILDEIGWQKLDLIIRLPDNLKSGIARVALDSGITL